MKSSHTIRWLHQRPGYSSQSVDTIFTVPDVLRHFVDDELLKIVKLSVPLVQSCVPRCALVVFVQLQHSSHLHHPNYHLAPLAQDLPDQSSR